jgi:hypothetical protein
MRDFKFFNKNNTISYNGQMSREAIQFLSEYSDHPNVYEITTTIATYKIADYVYGIGGSIVAGTINVYPLESPRTKITFKIRNGEITSHTIEIVDYWGIMGQLVNAIRRED